MYSSVASVHPHCCATITTIISRTFFILPNWNNNSSFSASTLVLALATPLLLSFSINLSALGTFYKWNHTISIQVSALNTVSNLLGHGISWWYSVFDFLRNHHITYEISPIHQQCTSLLIFLYVCQHILFFFLLIIAFMYFFFFKVYIPRQEI